MSSGCFFLLTVLGRSQRAEVYAAREARGVAAGLGGRRPGGRRGVGGGAGGGRGAGRRAQPPTPGSPPPPPDPRVGAQAGPRCPRWALMSWTSGRCSSWRRCAYSSTRTTGGSGRRPRRTAIWTRTSREVPAGAAGGRAGSPGGSPASFGPQSNRQVTGLLKLNSSYFFCFQDYCIELLVFSYSTLKISSCCSRDQTLKLPFQVSVLCVVFCWRLYLVWFCHVELLVAKVKKEILWMT